MTHAQALSRGLGTCRQPGYWAPWYKALALYMWLGTRNHERYKLCILLSSAHKCHVSDLHLAKLAQEVQTV